MINAKIHNAKQCTRDGSDHYIASFRDASNRMHVEGCDTPEEAREWLLAEARKRGEEVQIEISDRENAPVKFASVDPPGQQSAPSRGRGARR